LEKLKNIYRKMIALKRKKILRKKKNNFYVWYVQDDLGTWHSVNQSVASEYIENGVPIIQDEKEEKLKDNGSFTLE